MSRGAGARGFTLLEVVIALAIAALGLVGMFKAGSFGLVAVETAGRLDEAVERAQSHLAALGRGGAPLTVGDTQGDDGDGYRWRLRVAPMATRPPDANGTALSLLEVEASVSWGEGDRRRAVVLTTSRVGVAQ